MAFKGKYPFRSKIIINSAPLEHAVHSQHLGYYITYDDYDIIIRLQNLILLWYHKTQTARKETLLKFYKVMTITKHIARNAGYERKKM